MPITCFSLLLGVKTSGESSPSQKCCIRFAHIVGNILHAICMYATLFNVNLHMCKLQKTYKELGICAEYAQHQIYIFCIYAKYVQNTKYAECMHFAHMHSARMLHMCIVHIIIMRFAHKICCIYVNCTHPSYMQFVLMTLSLIM